MSKHKKHHLSPSSKRPASFQQTGLAAFRRNDFTGAIAAWQKLDLETAPGARAALAEAYFRRALGTREDAQRLPDLQQALQLGPTDARVWYHTGLTHHRLADLEPAQAAYARAAELGYPRRAALAFVRGLAALEADAGIDLEQLDWLTPDDRAALLPVAALLRDQWAAILDAPPGGWLDRLTAHFKDQAAAQLWRGLACFAAGQMAQAVQTLAAVPAALPPAAEAARALYHGWALVNTGNAAAAGPIWLAALKRGPDPALEEALALAGLHETQTLLAAGNPAGAVQAAERALAVAAWHPDLRLAAAIARHRLAQAAVAQQQWAEAVSQWSHMAALLDLKPLASWRPPVLHNLAVAYEQLEQREAAADAWAELLRALPRREPKARKSKTPPVAAAPTGVALDDQRRWLRRRIVDNYGRAGQPDQAIQYYKQAVKANPEDLDLRLELASALLANEQAVAARNELNRILEREPQHLEARVRLAEIHQLRGDWGQAEQSLRAVLAQAPDFEPARRSLVELLRWEGHDHFNAGRLAQARPVYAEALTLGPGDVDLLASLGHVEWQLNDEAAARAHFEAALARGEPEAFLEVFRRWAWQDQLDEARQVLERAEKNAPLSPDFYVDAAGACFTQAEPDWSDSPLEEFGPPRSKKEKARAQPWEQLGRELLDRATGSGRDRAEVLRHIIAELREMQPGLALEYAQQLAALVPDDAAHLAVLAFLQLVNNQVGPAKETLRKATRLARQSGDPELATHLEELRQLVSDPLFSQMGPMLPTLLESIAEADEDFYL